MMHIHKAKFVKNQKLQQLNGKSETEWGLLTMDQVQRVVLEGTQS